MEILDDNISIDDLEGLDGPNPETEYHDPTFPSLVVRIKALFIDIVIMLAVFTATTLIIDALGGVPDFVRGFILVFMVYLYDPLCDEVKSPELSRTRKENIPGASFREVFRKRHFRMDFILDRYSKQAQKSNS